MNRIRFVATIYQQENFEYPESAILLPEEIEKRQIKIRKVSDKEKRKIMRLKTRLQKMGNPWKRKEKHEKEKKKQLISSEEFKKLFDEKSLLALIRKEKQLNNPKKFEIYKKSKQYRSSLRAREKSMLEYYKIVD